MLSWKMSMSLVRRPAANPSSHAQRDAPRPGRWSRAFPAGSGANTACGPQALPNPMRRCGSVSAGGHILQFQHPGNCLPHLLDHRRLELPGSALQPMMFHSHEALDIGYALSGARQPANTGDSHFVVSTPHFGGQRHTDRQGALGAGVLARDDHQGAHLANNSKVHPIDFTRPWSDHRNSPGWQRARPKTRRWNPLSGAAG